jgi:hypothetical protein
MVEMLGHMKLRSVETRRVHVKQLGFVMVEPDDDVLGGHPRRHAKPCPTCFAAARRAAASAVLERGDDGGVSA